MTSKLKNAIKGAACFVMTCVMLLTLLPSLSARAAENADKGTPGGAPATAALSHDNYDGRTSYQIRFDIWWGNNATSYKLLENDVCVSEGSLEANSPNAQSKAFPVEKDENGTYTYKLELTNSYGTSESNTLSVTVTQAAAKPDVPQTPQTPDKTAAEAPVFSVSAGAYAEALTVEISCKTEGAEIYYTTDGTVPDADSLRYTEAVKLEGTTELRAIALKQGLSASSVTYAKYIIGGQPTDPGKPTEGLQKHLLIGYWHTWGGNASGGVPFVRLRDVDKNWDVVNIAFAEPVSAGSTDGRMKFEVSGLSADYTEADFKSDIKALQAEGKKIVLSIGGYEGYFSLTSQNAVNQFVGDIRGFIDEYGFDGIDIDLEQSSVAFDSGADPDYRNPKSEKIVNMIRAIRTVCESYGNDFILSWAPETFYVQLGYQFYGGLNAYCDSRAGVYLPMIHALRDKTSYVHVQLYNSMAITAPDGKAYSMGSAQSTVEMCKMLLDGFPVGGKQEYFFEPLRPDQIVIGVPASTGAAGSGHIADAELQSAFTTLNGSYPGLRGIMTWSINWDSYQNSDGFASANGAFLDSLN